MWAKGHSECRAKETVDIGQVMHLPDIPTPVGIRQSYRIHEVSKQVQSWDRETLKGLTHIVTNKGLTVGWLQTISRLEDGTSRLCEEIVIWNIIITE